MSAPQTSRAAVEQSFLLDRFSRLLYRRLQVTVAVRQLRAADPGQTWLIRALDGAIADDLRQLRRIGLADEAEEHLRSFRQTLTWLTAGSGQAA